MEKTVDLQKKEVFKELERLKKKGSIKDYDAELASRRELKYGK